MQHIVKDEVHFKSSALVGRSLIHGGSDTPGTRADSGFVVVLLAAALASEAGFQEIVAELALVAAVGTELVTRHRPEPSTALRTRDAGWAKHVCVREEGRG